MRYSGVTVLSLGAGQDSSALLELYINDPAFRLKYAPGKFLVVMSDTGNEFDETYQHVEYLRGRCEENQIEFHFLRNSDGYHYPNWLTLQDYYRVHGAIGSKAYPKVCTDKLKVQPIYRFLESWLGERYKVRVGRKKGFKDFAEQYGKIWMMLGIAAGEEKRANTPERHAKRPVWYQQAVEPIYPLIDLGMNRQGCQDYLKSIDQPVPLPSNCKFCPFLSLEELEFVRRFYPADLEHWIRLEAAKLEKYKDRYETPVLKNGLIVGTKNTNYGVFGTTPLPTKVEEAKTKFSSWSDERVREYRMSHGHCVASVY